MEVFDLGENVYDDRSSYIRLVIPNGKDEFVVIASDKKKNGMFTFDECFVNLNDKTIDKSEVKQRCDITEWDPMGVAVGAVDIYGAETFCKYHKPREYTIEQVRQMIEEKI